jgi:tRNA 5-methylaminomethyl-2-thiouridine biosynthesis bifunctional protein
LPDAVHAWWHANAGWVKPAALVQAWLAAPAVRVRGGVQVARVERHGDQWQVLDAGDAVLARAPLVVVAAAHASAALLGGRVVTHPVRGQVSWSVQAGAELPPFPVNGHGHFVPDVPTPEGPAWFSGSTYGRQDADGSLRAEDDAANLQRIRELLPAVGALLAPDFTAGHVRSWAGVRCASPDRRPLVGEVEPGLWVSTAMGSRGLTFAALCAELIAARLHAEPLPLPLRLAQALDVARTLRTPAR